MQWRINGGDYMRYVSQYNFEHKALEIYLAGCKGNCKGCHNPEMKSFDVGTELNCEEYEKIEEKIKSDLVENIWILGGEPIDRNIYELDLLIYRLSFILKPIWLFTRYELRDIQLLINNDLLDVDYIKVGPYIQELKTDTNIQHGVKLATSNQKILKKGVDY